MSMINAYREVGSYRGAAVMCDCDPKTVKRAVERAEAGGEAVRRGDRARNFDVVVDVVRARVAKTAGRISAKRLLPEARAAGYVGSARNFRRLVAKAKTDWRRDNHRGRRPGVWAPGETLVIDWGSEGPLHVFCAVLAWSRWRFVRFAADERSETTLAMLAECFEMAGGVAKVVLADRMGCLKGGVVANVVVPTPAYVRFATHYRFRPDFCNGADPESKGIVENLVGYAKADLMVPAAADVERLAAANVVAPLPSLRPRIGRVTVRKVDRLSCVRIGSARYSVPVQLIGAVVEVLAHDGRVKILDGDEIVADHALVAPGEASVIDDHYGSARPDRPRRAIRPVTDAEKAFCALGPPAEAFLRGAAAAGVTRLGVELSELAGLEAAHGRPALVAALERAVAFGRWRATDVRSILAAGTGTPRPTAPGEALLIPLPIVPTRPLADYAIADQS